MNDLEADLLIANAKIKKLEEQLADYHHMSELVDGKMEENQRLRRINENLQEQLAASQRRERAAVEDIPRCCATCAYAKANSGSQELCPWFDDCNQVDGDHWQWRGPQEAEEGATK